MKHEQACFSARKDLESSFNNCGGPVKLVQACLCAGKTIIIPFYPPKMRCEARAGLFKCQE